MPIGIIRLASVEALSGVSTGMAEMETEFLGRLETVAATAAAAAAAAASASVAGQTAAELAAAVDVAARSLNGGRRMWGVFTTATAPGVADGVQLGDWGVLIA